MDATAVDASYRLATLSARDEAALRRRWLPVLAVRALTAVQPQIKCQTESRAGFLRNSQPEQLAGSGPIATRLLDEALVIARLGEHTIAMRDTCGHQPYPLSRGRVCLSSQGEPSLRCAYHGWAWNELGRCVDLPSYPQPVTRAGLPPQRVPVYETQVAYGLIWVRLEPDAHSVLPILPGASHSASFEPTEVWTCDVAVPQCLEWMSRREPYARLIGEQPTVGAGGGGSVGDVTDVVDMVVVALAPADAGYLLLSPAGWRTTTVYRLTAAPEVDTARQGPIGATTVVDTC